ncbi:hypothetical protein [Aliikangiella coralliicola]|uniref:Uncharacterized protein n=1 Tax=Aliikangiella coralliicola TaxID=2592383 RepID=A0A545UD61_9GAMM|nr:hypothetical protein [Aliikangiella coralliicola]TQV87401.1 hypothetical protein FLL46_13225 [Aliikangiella coralliicola]
MIVSCLLILSVAPAEAHNSFLSFFTLQQKESGYLLTVNLSQATVQSAYESYSEKMPGDQNNLLTSNVNDQEKWLAQYLENTISLVAKGKRIPLSLESVFLGSHESKVTFNLLGLTSDIERLKINIRSFEDNPSHHNIFLLKSRFKSVRKILAKRNSFSSEIYFHKNEPLTN